MVSEGAGSASEPVGRALKFNWDLEAARRPLKSAGRASKPAGKAMEPAGKGPEPDKRASASWEGFKAS